MANIKTVLAIFSLVLVILVSGCIFESESEAPTGQITSETPETCPASCDDDLDYTKDSCSAETNYECKNDVIPNICRNLICEPENKENTFTCPTDCKRRACTEDIRCDDNNPCTKDTCTEGYCYNVALDVPCKLEGPIFEGTAGAGLQITMKGKDYYSNNNTVVLMGEVKNMDVVNFKDVYVNTTVYTLVGGGSIKEHVPLAESSARTIINILRPGDTSPFYITVEDVYQDIGKYDLGIMDYSTTKLQPYKDFKIEIYDYDRESDSYEIKVKNEGDSTANNVKGHFLFYNDVTKEVEKVGTQSESDRVLERGDSYTFLVHGLLGRGASIKLYTSTSTFV